MELTAAELAADGSSPGPTDPAGSAAARIRDRARQAGFDLVGIARAQELSLEKERLEAWLARGYHGEMRWMERDPAQRSDPGQLFPGARSVVAVALNYFRPDRHGEDPGAGKISRYAWGDDYHDVVGGKLRQLLEWIEAEFPGVDGKVCVDIQPMLDKVWAARAGLGWIGKHSNLITTQLGSWVFLGELILNLELQPDEDIVPDHCGTCTMCIDQCPTGAITEPYVVDSNRCISYATIEFRGAELPDRVSANLDGWLYGCDVCQDVCPWNRFEQATDEVRFAPREDATGIVLDEMLAMDTETYVERFRGSPMKRAKLSGLQRNANALKAITKKADAGREF